MHSDPPWLSFLDNLKSGNASATDGVAVINAMALLVSSAGMNGSAAERWPCRQCANHICLWHVDFLHGSRHLTKLAWMLSIAQDCIRIVSGCLAGQLSAANATMEEPLSAAGLRCLVWTSFPDFVRAILGQYIQHCAIVFQ